MDKIFDFLLNIIIIGLFVLVGFLGFSLFSSKAKESSSPSSKESSYTFTYEQIDRMKKFYIKNMKECIVGGPLESQLPCWIENSQLEIRW